MYLKNLKKKVTGLKNKGKSRNHLHISVLAAGIVSTVVISIMFNQAGLKNSTTKKNNSYEEFHDMLGV